MTDIDSTARIGRIVSSSNTAAEVDFYRGAPPSVTVHTARMHLGETTVAGERAMIACTNAGALFEKGLSEVEVRQMIVINPAKPLEPDGKADTAEITHTWAVAVGHPVPAAVDGQVLQPSRA